VGSPTGQRGSVSYEGRFTTGSRLCCTIRSSRLRDRVAISHGAQRDRRPLRADGSGDRTRVTDARQHHRSVAQRFIRLTQLSRTEVGRRELRYAILNKAWPLLSRAATLQRSTVGRSTCVVAVVGSFGKTTTARALVAALGLQQKLPRDNCMSHLAVAILRNTAGKRHAVMEVGIDLPGQMAAYAQMIRPDIVVVTSIGSEHNRSLGTIENVRFEKSRMVARLSSTGLAVLNGDDANVVWMRDHTKARAVTFGLGPNCDVRATDLQLDWPDVTRFKLHTGNQQRTARVRLFGQPAIYSVLAAVTVALDQGIPLTDTVDRMEALTPTSERLELVPLANGAFLLRDEFKSAAETVHAALDLLAAIPAHRKLIVLGDVTTPVSSQGPIYRAIGERLAGIVASAVFVGEGFERYRPGAIAGGLARSGLANAGRSVERATALIRDMLEPDDVVLIKGRSNQRLDRVALALMGREVRCDLTFCQFLKTRCDECSLLSRSDARAMTRLVFPPRR
jgi:UDP-N-acetylmuramoyl-tripeptide--D-alanyl-D-alanine ligase